jgi:hypothetical protein
LENETRQSSRGISYHRQIALQYYERRSLGFRGTNGSRNRAAAKNYDFKTDVTGRSGSRPGSASFLRQVKDQWYPESFLVV